MNRHDEKKGFKLNKRKKVEGISTVSMYRLYSRYILCSVKSMEMYYNENHINKIFVTCSEEYFFPLELEELVEFRNL